jgi:hypothetical protein
LYLILDMSRYKICSCEHVSIVYCMYIIWIFHRKVNVHHKLVLYVWNIQCIYVRMKMVVRPKHVANKE